MSTTQGLIVVVNWLALSFSTGLIVILAIQPRRERLNAWLAAMLVGLDVWAYFAMARALNDLSPLSETRNFYVLFTGLAWIPAAWFGLVVTLTKPQDGFGPLLALWGPVYVVGTAVLLWSGELLDYTATGGESVDFAFHWTGYVVAGHIALYLLLAYLYLHISKDAGVKPLRVPAALLIAAYATNAISALRLPPFGVALTALAVLLAGIWTLRRQLFGPLEAIQDELNTVQRDLRQALGELEVERNRGARLADDLSEAGRYKSEFLTRMGYEIRNPLNAIVGYSELLLNGVYGDLSEKQHDRIGKIHRNALDLLALIYDVLDLSKIEGGRMELNLNAVRVVPLAGSVIDAVMPQAEGKPLVVETALDTPLRLVRADEMRVRQVLLTLTGNAITYTPQGRVTLAARNLTVKQGQSPDFPMPVIGWLEDGDWLLLSVADTGVGIPPEEQATIFEEFPMIQGAEAREPGRTGLGLAIARKLVELHGGRIWVRSQPGEGSTFYVALPALDRFDEQAAPPPPESAPFTALVVSREERAADLFAGALAAKDPQIVRVADAPACVARAHEVHPDAVIADLLLPDCAAWDTVRRLKSDPELADLPVTLAAHMAGALFRLDLGACAVLTKPFQRDDLLAVLGRLQRRAPDAPALIIDDDPAERAQLCEALAAEQFPLVPCARVRAAWAWLNDSANRPGLVLLDLLMAEVNSMALLYRLRTAEHLRDVPVILLAVAEPTAVECATLHEQVRRVLRGDVELEA